MTDHPTERRCAECGVDISSRAPQARRCIPCAAERNREAIRHWRAANRGKRRSAGKRWRFANRDKVAAKNARYRAANPEICNAARRRWRARIRAEALSAAAASALHTTLTPAGANDVA